tara:strand:- start:196 stop:558 length:363 start_codon:yes stop_codon:yes gene_type:complete
MVFMFFFFSILLIGIIVYFSFKDYLEEMEELQKKNNIQKLFYLFGTFLTIYTIYYGFSDYYLAKYGILIGFEAIWETPEEFLYLWDNTEKKYLASWKWFICLIAFSITLFWASDLFKNKN